jgi:RHS repeat-associated protein
LTHAFYRQLSTTEGRWITTDPAGMAAVDPTNPQSWNRYAYVENTPVNAADPLGLHCPVNVSPPPPGCGGGGDGSDVFTDWGWDNYWAGGGSWGGGFGGGSGFGIGISGSTCSDFMPCGMPYPSLGQSIWSDLLGLPSNLDCPQWMGPMCGGLSPIMDAEPGCARAATLGAVSVGLDILGAIPGLGNVVSGVVATGKVAIRVKSAVDLGVNYGGAGYGMATGIGDESPVGAVTAGTALGLTLADAAIEGGKVIPVVGNVFSALTAFYDSYQLGKTVAQCWGGG